MNNQEAQLILQAYRPGGEDAADPLVAEALEQARRDPELQKWFAEEQAFDLRVQAKVRTAVLLPPELKANLLALQRMARPVRWWRRPVWLAAAAMVVWLLGLAIWRLPPGNPVQLDSFRKTMVGYSMQRRGHVTFEASDMATIQQWLSPRGVTNKFDLPEGLRGKTVEGCRVVDWNGQKVTLLCFVLAGGHHLDLFVIDRAGIPGLAGNSAPQFTQADALMTATWTKGDQVYLLTGSGDKKLMQKLFQQS